MKILFVTPFLPSPPRFGGQRRLDGLMRSLAKNHDVSLISFTASDEFKAMSIEATEAYCNDVTIFPDMELVARRDKRLLQARSLLSLHSYEHLLVARRREFLARLQQLIDSGGFDIVQVEFVQMAALKFRLPSGRRFRTVLDEHNIEFDIVKRTANASVSPGRRLYSAVDWRKLKREEVSAWQRFDGVTVTSQRDAAILSALEPKTNVVVVPNGVDIELFQPNSTPPEPASLLFFGAMNYYPNQDGLSYFLERIFPLILAKRPNTKLRVVGPAPESVKRLQNANIEVTGFVDAVEPYIDAATAVIVPLRLGGGTRLKIVEAMAKAKPIISTRVGAEGIDVVNGESALLADEPQEFARHVESVLSDEGLAHRLGAAARKLAEDRYSWPALVAGLERFYAQLLTGPATEA
jgi:glycosyltransferase involved in cell wall biosynthesis